MSEQPLFHVRKTSLLLIFIITISITSVNACQKRSCNRRDGPVVRFPFWLNGSESSKECRYHGFELFCDEKGNTVLELPNSVKVLVKKINYLKQQIQLYDPQACIPNMFSDINLSSTPFRSLFYRNMTLFNCSGGNDYLNSIQSHRVGCLSNIYDYIVYAFPTYGTYIELPLVSCSKMYKLSSVLYYLDLKSAEAIFKWKNPNCSSCESKRLGCRLSSNTSLQTECFKYPFDKEAFIRKLIVAGSVVGSFLVVLFAIGLFFVYRNQKNKEETRLKIKKFLEDYKSLKPTRYTYADLKKITNKFTQILGKGGFGTVFKGRLSNDVLVAVKLLDDFTGNGDDFINEMGSMARIHHVNVARLVGFCADGYHRALVYEYLSNESLEKFIFPRNKSRHHFLSWEKLCDIALGIAKGIEYLHQGCDLQILHFDIKPTNILLDADFIPKISDFGLAKLYPKEKSAVSMTAARGTMGYIAPEVLSRNFGNVSYKSDVYSYGMLLLEMVGGRRNIDGKVENTNEVYFPEWVYNHLDSRKELSFEIEDEDETQTKIVRKLAIVGLWCIQWSPIHRPSMKAVVQMLEGETNALTFPPNPFGSSGRMNINAVIPQRPFNIELEVITEVE